MTKERILSLCLLRYTLRRDDGSPNDVDVVTCVATDEDNDVDDNDAAAAAFDDVSDDGDDATRGGGGFVALQDFDFELICFFYNSKSYLN